MPSVLCLISSTKFGVPLVAFSFQFIKSPNVIGALAVRPLGAVRIVNELINLKASCKLKAEAKEVGFQGGVFFSSVKLL